MGQKLLVCIVIFLAGVMVVHAQLWGALDTESADSAQDRISGRAAIDQNDTQAGRGMTQSDVIAELPDAADPDKEEMNTTRGIEHEDIGIADEDEPTEYDAAGRIVAATDTNAPETDDEVLVAFEQGDTNGGGTNEITMDDTQGSEESTSSDSIWIDLGYPAAEGYNKQSIALVTGYEEPIAYVCIANACACSGDDDCDAMFVSGKCDGKDSVCVEDVCACSTGDNPDVDLALEVIRAAQGVGFGDGVRGSRPPTEDSKYVPPGTFMDDDIPAGDAPSAAGDFMGEDLPAPSKPKEIVVVGSKVREAARTDKGNDVLMDTPMWLDADVETEEELSNYAVALALTDENIEEISLTTNEITVDYQHPASLFGFIDVQYTATTTVDKAGRVTVKFPWWLGFAENNAEELKTAIGEEFEKLHAQHELTHVVQQDAAGEDMALSQVDLQQQQKLIQTISSVSKQQHDAAMAVIRKIG